VIGTYVTSLVRTLVPFVVGWLLSLPLAGPVLDALDVSGDQARGKLAAALTVLLGAAWYALARLIEHRWPKAGVLLGVPTSPVYPTQAPADSAAAIAAAAGGQLVTDDEHSAP
jgi:hypothetical protein